MACCLVVGASGYVGSLLVGALHAGGHRVRALARSLDPATLPDGVDAIRADVLDAPALAAALSEVDVVYHLVHSMAGADFAAADDRIAHAVADAAARAGVRQLIYLGGPRPTDGPASEHLASRAAVGDTFLAAPTPALVLQASMIIGRGSASFELLGRAARSGPVLLRPSWMDNRSRPIAIADVLYHLLKAASDEPVNMIGDIAGPDTLTYLELVQRYARVAGLPWRLPVPVTAVSTGTASAAVAAMTPLSTTLVRALLDSLRHDLAPDGDTDNVLPPPPGGATPTDRAIRAALGDPVPVGPPENADGLVRDRKVLRVRTGTAELWRVITDIGGAGGWHTMPGAWTLRGALDHLVGGVGLHRGRPDDLAAGDTVDSWTVIDRHDDDGVLLLRADLRLPGTAWLEMQAAPGERAGESSYRQTVTFVPTGLAGKLYWYAQKPAHDVVFGLMARGLVRAAEAGG
ncbi:DUF2867 domain-containing protein [Actinokineospora sp.]|uniref:DUF2867 domain-containing protein n=1 Tax=Actinokineospora sp. TaxID=1872133 RepID=UPI00403829C9